MLLTGVILAGLMVGASFMIWLKLPAWTKRLFLRFDLVTDLGLMILCTILFGMTVTGLIAAGVTGILVSIGLKIGKDKLLLENRTRSYETNLFYIDIRRFKSVILF